MSGISFFQGNESWVLFGHKYVNLADWACEETHGTCVKHYKTQKTWAEARDFCLALGTDLPSVVDATYQSWVTQYSYSIILRNFINIKI